MKNGRNVLYILFCVSWSFIHRIVVGFSTHNVSEDLQPQQRTFQDCGMWQKVSFMSEVYLRRRNIKAVYGAIFSYILLQMLQVNVIPTELHLGHLCRAGSKWLAKFIETVCDKTKAEFNFWGLVQYLTHWPSFSLYYCSLHTARM